MSKTFDIADCNLKDSFYFLKFFDTHYKPFTIIRIIKWQKISQRYSENI